MRERSRMSIGRLRHALTSVSRAVVPLNRGLGVGRFFVQVLGWPDWRLRTACFGSSKLPTFQSKDNVVDVHLGRLDREDDLSDVIAVRQLELHRPSNRWSDVSHVGRRRSGDRDYIHFILRLIIRITTR